MKNSIKIIAAIAVAAALSTSVFASDVIVFKRSSKTTAAVNTEETETAKTVTEDDSYIFVNGSWYKKVDNKEAEAAEKTSKSSFIITDGKVLKTASEQGDASKAGTVFVDTGKTVSVCSKCTMNGGKYYSYNDAKILLDEYFEENSSSLILVEGEESGFTSGAYVISSDPSVVCYDKETGKIKAVSYGSCELYLYTTGGIPYYKVNVSVVRDMLRSGAKDSLVLDCDDWHLAVDDFSYITVTSLSGKKYEDIAFKILNDNGSAVVGASNGKVTGLANGAVLVQAYSKSNPDICGEAVLYVGEYLNAVKYGGWKTCKAGVSIEDWYTGYFTNPCEVEGYIRSASGIMIPVVKEIEVTKIDYDGTKKETTALVSGTVSYADLLKELYGDKESFADVIEKYNLFKYGKTCSDRNIDLDELDADDIRLVEAAKLIYKVID